MKAANRAQGYELAEKADKLTLQKQFRDASSLYREAASVFEKQIGITDNEEINSALRMLWKQNLQRSKELAFLQNQQVVQRNNIAPSVPSSPSSSRTDTNFRGIPKDDNIKDPVTKLEVQLNQIIKPLILNINSTNINKNIDSIDNIEKTHLQKTIVKSGKSIEELELENTTLKQIISKLTEQLEVYNKNQQFLNKNVNLIINEFKTNQQRVSSQKDLRINELTNDKVQLQDRINSLEKRWETLVKSAKKKRDEKNKV